MWLITEIGFFSAVRDRNTDQTLVRARDRRDLERLCRDYIGYHTIETTEDSDYRHRLRVDPMTWSRAVADLASAINYGNFKDRVADTLGAERAAIYMEVWHDLYEIQRAEVRDELVRQAMTN